MGLWSGESILTSTCVWGEELTMAIFLSHFFTLLFETRSVIEPGIPLALPVPQMLAGRRATV